MIALSLQSEGWVCANTMLIARRLQQLIGSLLMLMVPLLVQIIIVVIIIIKSNGLALSHTMHESYERSLLLSSLVMEVKAQLLYKRERWY